MTSSFVILVGDSKLWAVFIGHFLTVYEGIGLFAVVFPNGVAL